MIDFDGRDVVVTGAAGGVGSALVTALSSCNARVIACDRPGSDLDADGIAEAHHFDLLDDTALDTFAGHAGRTRSLAAVISNAGATRIESLEALTAEGLDHEMALNFRSAARLSQALIPAMRNQPAGAAFVFVSSVNAVAHFGNPGYSAAKAGLLAWMRAIATEEGRNGIRANAVLPGSIRTAAWAHRMAERPEVIDTVAKLYPLGRLVEPEEVARAIVFLASPMASGITGVSLNVDAGLLASNLPFFNEIVR